MKDCREILLCARHKIIGAVCLAAPYFDDVLSLRIGSEQ